MQFTTCTTRKPLSHDPYDSYKSYRWTDAIYDSYQVGYIGHGWFAHMRNICCRQNLCLRQKMFLIFVRNILCNKCFPVCVAWTQNKCFMSCSFAHPRNIMSNNVSSFATSVPPTWSKTSIKLKIDDDDNGGGLFSVHDFSYSIRNSENILQILKPRTNYLKVIPQKCIAYRYCASLSAHTQNIMGFPSRYMSILGSNFIFLCFWVW